MKKVLTIAGSDSSGGAGIQADIKTITAHKMYAMSAIIFTSGTTGYPKMVCHDHTYPIAHIVTAKYWHNVDPDGLHLTVSETGWASSCMCRMTFPIFMSRHFVSSLW